MSCWAPRSTAPHGDGGFLGPYVWFTNASFDAAFVPLLYTNVLRRADGQHLPQLGPWFRIEGPGYKSQGLFPALRPLRRRE